MENKMQEIKIEKVVLSVSSTAENLEKGVKMLERLTGRKPIKRKSTKRIPSLNVRPGLEVGAMVTLRGNISVEILRKMLAAVDNIIRKRSVSENSFSFGIKEYIEIPGMTYQRDVGILGLDVTITFARAGKRVARRKIKKGKLPKKQNVSEEEIVEYLRNNLNVRIK